MSARPDIARIDLRQLLPLDVAISVCIIVLAMSVLIGERRLLIDKGRLTEPLLNMATLRVDTIERLSLDGVLAAPTGQPVRVGEPPTRFDYLRDGSGLIAAGRLGPTQAAVRLGVRAAVDDSGWSVLWLCGRRAPPPGWSSPTPPLAEGFAPGQIPSVCNDSPGR